jgi:hypothetical protein
MGMPAMPPIAMGTSRRRSIAFQMTCRVSIWCATAETISSGTAVLGSITMSHRTKTTGPPPKPARPETKPPSSAPSTSRARVVSMSMWGG